jgi:23S rRNA (uracil1939-C5)-methyltransferase
VTTLGCRVVEPPIDDAARRLAPLLERTGLAAHDERARTGALRYALVRSNDRGQLLVAIVTTGDAPPAPLRRAAAALRRELPAVVGVIWVRNDARGGALLAPDQQTLAGARVIEQRVGPITLEVSIGAFFQINRAQAARIYARVAELTGAGRGIEAVDLYCGVGGLALTLADRGARVLGIEREPEAVAAARRAAVHNRLAERARFEIGTADAVARLAGRPGLICVNPPRKGLDEPTRDALLALAPERIAYVSCAPDTLARDLAVLTAGGYRVERIAPYDLMPGTAQIETIALCRRDTTSTIT